MKKYFQAIRFLISSLIGLITSASIGFHLGLLRELTFTNKLIYITLLSIPIIWLSFFLFTQLSTKSKPERLLLPIMVSFFATTLFLLFVYQEIKPLQSHSFQLHLPELTQTGSSVSLTKAYTAGIFTKDISIESFEFTGPVNHAKYGEMILLGGSTTNLNQIFSGSLHLVLKPTDCPLYADILFDDEKSTLNLCDLNSAGEIIFAESTNGITSLKWRLAQKFFLIIDTFLLFSIFFFLSYVAIYVVKHLKNYKCETNKKQLRFFLIALFSAIFVTALIFWVKLPDLELFIPIIVLLAGYQIYIQYQKRTQNRLNWIILIVSVLICGIFINLRVEHTQYFALLDASLEGTKNDRGNSFNSLVTAVLKPLPYSLFYGFGDILINRELVTSQEIITTYDVDTTLVEKLLRDNLLIDNESKYLLTGAEYTCILNQPHIEWTTFQNNKIVSLTKDFFSGDERAIFIQYQDTLLLLPQSIFSDTGVCQ